jgi:hypothetical protein
VGLADNFWILGKQFRANSPMSAITRDVGDDPILRCLDPICDPNGGPAMIAWLLAFLGFPPPPWGFPCRKTGFAPAADLGRFAAAAPGENLKRMLNERRTEVNSKLSVLADLLSERSDVRQRVGNTGLKDLGMDSERVSLAYYARYIMMTSPDLFGL